MARAGAQVGRRLRTMGAAAWKLKVCSRFRGPGRVAIRVNGGGGDSPSTISSAPPPPLDGAPSDCPRRRAGWTKLPQHSDKQCLWVWPRRSHAGDRYEQGGRNSGATPPRVEWHRGWTKQLHLSVGGCTCDPRRKNGWRRCRDPGLNLARRGCAQPTPCVCTLMAVETTAIRAVQESEPDGGVGNLGTRGNEHCRGPWSAR